MKSKQQAGYPGVNRMLSEKTNRWFLGCSVLLFNLIVVVLMGNQEPSHLQRADIGLSKD
jgi:hypothetical protein